MAAVRHWRSGAAGATCDCVRENVQVGRSGGAVPLLCAVLILELRPSAGPIRPRARSDGCHQSGALYAAIDRDATDRKFHGEQLSWAGELSDSRVPGADAYCANAVGTSHDLDGALW